MEKRERRIIQLLDDIFLAQAQTSSMVKALDEMVKLVDDSPLVLWEHDDIERLAKASIYVLFCDVITNEDVEIRWALRTYAYITQALLKARERNDSPEKLFEILKHRVMLLNSHDDFFFETLQYFLFHKAQQKETPPDPKELTQFLRARVASMQYQDLMMLEKYIPDLMNDEFLMSVAEQVEDKYNFNEQQLVEAQLLSDTLFKFVWYSER